MFFLKKFISGFLVPSTVCMLLMAAGRLLLWFTGRQRLGKILTTVGIGLLVLFSNPALSELMLAPLENRNAPLYPGPAAASDGPPRRGDPRLDRGAVGRPHRRPPGSAQRPAGQCRHRPGDRGHSAAPAAARQQAAAVRGHRRRHAERSQARGSAGRGGGRVRGRSADGGAAQVGLGHGGRGGDDLRVVGTQPFLLVTSASHMPRALGLFRRRGAQPIAASAFLYTMDEPGFSASDMVPSPGALNASNAGMHEYIGLVWSKLRGRL